MEKRTEAEIENMHKVLKSYQKTNGFGDDNGQELKIIEPGHIEYRMTVTERHLGTKSAAHGGSMAGLMDALVSVAALTWSACDLKAVGTVEMKMNFMNPALLGYELVGIGKVDHAGRRLIVASGEIWCPAKNLLIAKGSGTMNAYPIEKADLEPID